MCLLPIITAAAAHHAESSPSFQGGQLLTFALSDLPGAPTGSLFHGKIRVARATCRVVVCLVENYSSPQH